MNTAYIALGSNMGNRKETMEMALQEMEKNGIHIDEVATYRETKPYGVTDQPDFLNTVAKISTHLSSDQLMLQLLEIEKRLGRVRTRHWGPRTIDLDVILYNDEINDSELVTLPHPDMHNRDFVLIPMVELSPELKHPVLKKTMRELLQDLLNQ